MSTYRRRVRVDAPLDEVWKFHSRIEGLEALTPGFMNLRVDRVTGSDGEPDPEVLATGTTIEMSMRPFGVAPRQRWVSRIEEREADLDAGRATFVDTMTEGPFPTWQHTHRFYESGDQTVVDDEVRYELPGGPVGRAVSPLGWIGFEPMFRYRHRRTRELLE
ncbi:SRPBCC family protein [Halobaculum sp. CBA1158]|uniref:SRPBCC family protein n=1 Tax=Halobaculum sp. CBA1158 TaxID=2904243 RepID=UPI001F3F41C4|nr:SRPBCC family protein [Halobaculum sp. CBA1158]UIO98731.1 SRPBCC family protein [Halobaculum sp. CBA1158]